MDTVLAPVVLTEQQVFLDKLIKSAGGCIVSSVLCSLTEVETAQIEGRYYEDEAGFKYVLRTREWMSNVSNSEMLITELKRELAKKQPRRRRY